MDSSDQSHTDRPQPSGPEPNPGVAAAPTTGWAVPPTSATTSSSIRPSLAVAWVAAVIIVGFLALVRSAAESGPSGYRAGYAIGGLVMPFVVAGVARWAVLRLRRGKPGATVGVLRSRWVPLGAVALAVLASISSLTALGRTPVDPASAVRIGPGFSLRDPDPAVAQEVTQVISEGAPVGEVVVREVVGEDGSLSLLVVADSGLGPGHVFDLVRGVAVDSGLVAQLETVEGQRIATGLGEDLAIAAWIETPLLLVIYAPDESTMRAITTSILGTPRAA
jgi:hypothetical protein